MRNILLTILALCGLTASAAFTHSNFAKSSRFSTGKWVKIAVGETGIYEISYETLRGMGFSDPKRVGVYGRGGAQYDENFQSPTQQILYSDEVLPVPIYQSNDKIYFYGISTEKMELTVNTTGYTFGGYMKRLSNNIYSSTAYYFLSDYQEPKKMSYSYSTGLTAVDEIKSGIGIVYHENDIYHNIFNTGQLFYGERYEPWKSRLEFDVQLPGALPGREGMVECVAYGDKVKGTKFRYGFNENELIEAEDNAVVTTEFTPFRPTLSTVVIPSENSKFITELDFSANDGDEMDICNLDYWVVSYERSIPTLIAPDGSRMASDRILFPKIPRPQTRKVRIPNGINRMVFDISDPTNPRYIYLSPNGNDAMAKLTNNNGTPDIVIIDPLMPQLQIKDYSTDYYEIQNQDLHSQAANGADLIIITIPQLKDAAERLADVHRQVLGQRVIVATAEECYNEFSGGTPDPMAYRALVKMAHTSDYGCKNLFLIGPLYADFRGIGVEKNPGEGIIAYQSASTSTERGGFNNNDFYGVMTNNTGYYKPEAMTVDVGVGVLPIRYPSELNTYTEKVRKYLERKDCAYFLNHYLSIGGVGDADLHTAQVPVVDTCITALKNRSVINTQLAIDAYGYLEAREKMLHTVNEGVSLVTYYGHGNPQKLNQNGHFFDYPDVFKFRNNILSFWGFAGCELSEPDKGRKGLGEAMVTATPYGAIGTLLASRLTWSSMNMDLFKKLHANILRKGGLETSKTYKDATTIGEMYAGMKTQSTYPNEQAYLLMCDPAIIFPTINRFIAADQEEIPAQPGEWIEVSGYVKDFDSEDRDTDFSGEVVVRLMEPLKQVECPHIVLLQENEKLPEKKDDIPIMVYADTQVAMAAGTVKDGQFSVKLMIPESAAAFDGQSGRIHICAYDPETRLGAGAMVYANFMPNEKETSTLSQDKISPVIERFEFNSEDASLNIRVSDDVALAFNTDPLKPPFKLILDGKEFRQGLDSKPAIDTEAMAYEKSITLDDINEGSHTAKVIVRDAAGNETAAEIIFDYMPTLSPYSIALEQKAVDGRGVFYAINEPPVDADIVIITGNGFIVRRDKFSNGKYEWDARDNDGNRVAPGLYKAYIIETGSNSRKGHSALINVPVI